MSATIKSCIVEFAASCTRFICILLKRYEIVASIYKAEKYKQQQAT